MSTKNKEDAKTSREGAIILPPPQLCVPTSNHVCDWCAETFECLGSVGPNIGEWCYCWQAIVTAKKADVDRQYLAHYCCEEHFDDDLCPDDSTDDEVTWGTDAIDHLDHFEDLDLNDL